MYNELVSMYDVWRTECPFRIKFQEERERERFDMSRRTIRPVTQVRDDIDTLHRREQNNHNNFPHRFHLQM